MRVSSDTNKIQSVSLATEQSRSVLTFLIILGIAVMLCCLKLVQEGTGGIEISEKTKSFQKRFQETAISYQLQKATPCNHKLEAKLQFYHYQQNFGFGKCCKKQVSGMW